VESQGGGKKTQSHISSLYSIGANLYLFVFRLIITYLTVFGGYTHRTSFFFVDFRFLISRAFARECSTFVLCGESLSIHTEHVSHETATIPEDYR
jgi:hypothetical protein